MPKRKISTTRVARTTAETVVEDDELETGQAPGKKARNGDITPILPKLDAPATILENGEENGEEADEVAGSAEADVLQTPTKRGRGSKVLAKVADLPVLPAPSPQKRSSRAAAKKVDYGENGDGEEDEAETKTRRSRRAAKVETEEMEQMEQTTATPKKTRTPRKATKKAVEENGDVETGIETPTPKTTRTPRKRATKKTAELTEEMEVDLPELDEPAKTPKRTPRRRASKKVTKTEEDMEEDGSDFETPKKTAKRTPRKRATKKADDDADFNGGVEAPEPEDSEVKPKRRRKKEKIILTMEQEIELLDKDLKEMDEAWEADVRGELFPDKEPMTTAYNSTDDPLPYTGRLGYACLNTHLRAADPPVFCSRTCRLATLAAAESSLEHAQQLGLANAWDLVKLIEWNEAHGIKFLRISSEMFPFASHPDHVYDLNFAAEPLAKAGELAAKWGHRLTTHPGQFTQLASPRKEVIRAAIADLKYHHEMLSMLKLPSHLDKDSVIILHIGGVFGDKEATLARFKETWATLPKPIQNRIVLENDDVSYSVHDILPICQELEIPLVLDWHHHNIVHDESIREGTLDILPLLPAIADTWRPRGIKQKMHYSEPVPGSRGRDRRKHSEIVRFLPPGLGDVDLMIEAKGKERAVWGLMRRYGLAGWERKPGPEVVPVVIGKGKVVEKAVKEEVVKEEVVAMEEEVFDTQNSEAGLSDELIGELDKQLDEEEDEVE